MFVKKINRRPFQTILGRVALAFTFALTLVQLAIAQQTRTWVDSSGQFKIEASFEQLSGENVLLKLPDGELKQIPLSMLSDPDKDYVEELTKPAAPATQPNEPLGGEANPEPIKKKAPKPTPPRPVASQPLKPTSSPAATAELDISPPQKTPAPNLRSVNQPSSTQTPRVANADPTLDSITESENLRPAPIINIGKRIGDLDINEIVPPPVVNGFRSNPKYLLPVERSDLATLPTEFQGVALLLLNEAREPRKAIRGLDYLKVHWPQNRQPTLIKLVINCASSNYKYNRESALQILADRDSDQSFAYIFARVDDTSFTIRSTAYEILRVIGDRRVVGPVAKRFDTDDVDRIASLLRFFGSESEPAVLPYLTHDDPDIRLRACNLLGKIGTPKSLPALQEMASREETRILQAQTRSSINKIKRRNELN